MFTQYTDKPFSLELSFYKVVEGLKQAVITDKGYKAERAKELLARIEKHPELDKGITSIQQITHNADLIADLLSDLFPQALANNEIKAVSIPYMGLSFNQTARFKKILADAGAEFQFAIRDFDDTHLYILSCCIILNRLYGTKLDFTRPMFYDIPTADGVMRHYRILYNGDFLEVLTTDKAPKLSKADIDELMDNYDNVDLWKEKFPVNSYVVKGFGLMTLIDVTVENALSTLKSNLLGSYTSPDIKENLITVFRSMYGIADMRMGFTLYDTNEGKFVNSRFGPGIHSFLVPYQEAHDGERLLCGESYECIVKDHTYFAVSDVSKYIKQERGNSLGEHLKKQGINSFILAPVVKDNVLLGIIELVSPRIRELNSVTANKLDIVMPFLVDTIDRKMHELQDRVRSVIQQHYTTLHPSVYWKFRREAQNFLECAGKGLTYQLKEIKFKEVFPLYGQVDISESSATRNLSVCNDLTNQLNELISILTSLAKADKKPVKNEKLDDLKNFVIDLKTNFRADTEQFIQHYIEENIHPILKEIKGTPKLKSKIEKYFSQTDTFTGDYHNYRRNYDKTLSLINQKLATIIDMRQAEIQEFYPHYYERFKTDGVEHNIYIGQTIAPSRPFTPSDLHRLRLWQLRVIAEMEVEQYNLKSMLPYQLGVTSLILVFSTPLAIRFRMHEKHFDVDGAYNIRYEVIKKRIDKAMIKGTRERITKQGKITIVYAKAEERKEYEHYISILQNAGVLNDDVEHFEVEELQGVAGLKALRVGLIHTRDIQKDHTIDYSKLYKHLPKT
ncbi:GAF domain-containing protein [Mucilaginibacter sp. dw_454]|uniref:GAF domain-containing protein n=1 Tax=Mucilaginibacter sp. dw_454 TaxID=2720079 RepID=UPI001BD6B25C|nr:GAF domain-containing protein [Mucilaginibacter sp. dw_454]